MNLRTKNPNKTKKGKTRTTNKMNKMKKIEIMR